MYIHVLFLNSSSNAFWLSPVVALNNLSCLSILLMFSTIVLL
jgi:hypothetical protein